MAITPWWIWRLHGLWRVHLSLPAGSHLPATRFNKGEPLEIQKLIAEAETLASIDGRCD